MLILGYNVKIRKTGLISDSERGIILTRKNSFSGFYQLWLMKCDCLHPLFLHYLWQCFHQTYKFFLLKFRTFSGIMTNWCICQYCFILKSHLFFKGHFNFTPEINSLFLNTLLLHHLSKIKGWNEWKKKNYSIFSFPSIKKMITSFSLFFVNQLVNSLKIHANIYFSII